VFKTIIIGGTGATGRQLIKQLIQKENCQSITSIGRKPVLNGKKNDKLVDVVVDSLNDLSQTEELWKGNDIFFNCIGTTRQRAGGAKEFIDIELGISKEAARMASIAQIPHVSLISANGANHKIWAKDWLQPLLYMKTIGQKEQTILSAFHFNSVSIFRPGMLIRLMGKETWYDSFATILGFGLRVDILASAMIKDAELSTADSVKEPSKYFIGNSSIRDSVNL